MSEVEFDTDLEGEIEPRRTGMLLTYKDGVEMPERHYFTIGPDNVPEPKIFNVFFEGFGSHDIRGWVEGKICNLTNQEILPMELTREKNIYSATLKLTICKVYL